MLRRVLLASSGLVLLAFLIAHLIGVAIATIAPMRFEQYANALHHSWWLPLIEALLLCFAVVHAGLSLNKTLENWLNAGNHAKLRSRREDPLGSWSARLQPIGGLTLLLFLAIHLKQLRLPRPTPGLEVLRLSSSLHSPLILGLYCAACLALSLHIIQGGESAQRSLGLLTPQNASMIRLSARAVGVLLGLGFAGSAGWFALHG